LGQSECPFIFLSSLLPLTSQICRSQVGDRLDCGNVHLTIPALIANLLNPLFMPKNIWLYAILIICPLVTMAQTLKHVNKINGEVIGKPSADDTIFFITSKIAPKYFENLNVSAKIIHNQYDLIDFVTYPQMFSIIFGTDRNKRPWRNGDYL